MKLVIFEDGAFEQLYPLTYMRPTFELRCGRTLLREKIERAAGRQADAVFVRDWLAAADGARRGGSVNDLSALKGDDLLLVNGRVLWLGDAKLPAGREVCGRSQGEIAFLWIGKDRAASIQAASLPEFLASAAAKVPAEDVDAQLVTYPWDLIDRNADAIRDDFAHLKDKGVRGTLAEGSYIWGPKDRVYVAPGAVVEPCVAIDTHDGPVIIEEDVVVNPHTRIQGPASVGRKTILVGGKIREGTTIGPVCRVGGEVEEAIFHAYSNKYHDGFIGHAYVGEWVNLGALTTNSDLKNDYSTVEVIVGGQLRDSGSTKVGCFIGDHTKTSIGTLINTGTMIGMMSNILGVGHLLPKSVPSFVMFMDGKFFKAGLKQLTETARTAMGRRKMELLPAEEALLKFLFDLTAEERMQAVRKSRKAMMAEKGLTPG